MRLDFAFLAFVVVVRPVVSQQIWDIWQTTWDRDMLFTYFQPSPVINFTSPSTIGEADIVVNDTQVYQSVLGFGGSLTDSSALLLNNLKTQNSSNYWTLLDYLFNPTDGADSAGLTFVRVPLGASDFSAALYSFDDTTDDNALADFNINAAPSYLFSVLRDIQSVNSYLRVLITPWSPPGWMKDSGTMTGGNFLSAYTTVYANYLLKCLQGFQSQGVNVYAIAIQNEPENSNPTYPTCNLTASQEAQIGLVLRPLMDDNGFSGVIIIGYDHNWNDATGYPVQLMQQASSAFAGVSFHCYAGTVDEQADFYAQYPQKEIYFTECSGTYGSDWWCDIKWYMDNLFIGSIQYYSQSGLMWNIALDGSGNPKLPTTNSCGGAGCRPIVTVNSDGSYSVNQEFYSMAQASKAILPRDQGGPWGQRIGVTVGGELSWALIVGAYVTGRVSSTDWLRYSLVVLNWDDSVGGWNPQPVQTTIEFRGMQATYTFPVGVTTLWWYAPNEGFDGSIGDAFAQTPDGQQTPLHFV
ncbi:glycoside hydrolase family 30 protein [Jaapia argillacea MUCL 33604]|uniref:Glycoside hydrolase family 30 protein n=1 Tax=Jaapia argillacea MUCL 33604 TaxID=933084 RepID=A0A067PQ35_9AGAM|nr:glycoside hydrolase family 30 protein [Jaapia argillacea MUCL 33604]